MASKSIDESDILNAAAEVFAEKGFAGARVDEIAFRAGVNKAMLYYRIGDKEELYRRVVVRGQEGFRSAMMKSLAETENALDTFGSIILGVAEHAFNNRLLPSIILREFAGGASTLPAEALENLREFTEIIRSTMTMGREEGAFRDVDTVTLQFLVIGTILVLSRTVCMRRELLPDSPGPVTAAGIANSLKDILFHGIRGEGSQQ
ncbi:MAG: TetR/AcrR family transcriptional regulator [Candidatus Fermentibacteraceae bacterium]